MGDQSLRDSSLGDFCHLAKPTFSPQHASKVTHSDTQLAANVCDWRVVFLVRGVGFFGAASHVFDPGACGNLSVARLLLALDVEYPEFQDLDAVRQLRFEPLPEHHKNSSENGVPARTSLF
jgi:hypothetical protein